MRWKKIAWQPQQRIAAPSFSPPMWAGGRRKTSPLKTKAVLLYSNFISLECLIRSCWRKYSRINVWENILEPLNAVKTYRNHHYLSVDWWEGKNCWYLVFSEEHSIEFELEGAVRPIFLKSKEFFFLSSILIYPEISEMEKLLASSEEHWGAPSVVSSLSRRPFPFKNCENP